MKRALLILNAQHEYSRAGSFPLWNIEATVTAIETKILEFNQQNELVIFAQQISPNGSILFEAGSPEIALFDQLTLIANNLKIIQKHFPNAFEQTDLLTLLTQQGIECLEVCGMMTQNCVLFTAISEQAKYFQVKVLANYCTSISQVIHESALLGLTRMAMIA